MNTVDGAMQTLAYYFRLALGFLLGLLGLIESLAHDAMNWLRVPPQFQQAGILLVAIVFIVAVLSWFGGLIRLLLMVFLILFVLHVLVPNMGM